MFSRLLSALSLRFFGEDITIAGRQEVAKQKAAPETPHAPIEDDDDSPDLSGIGAEDEIES